MPVIINGSTGISGTDGSASTPALQGTDTNTGLFFPAADTIAFAEGGVEAMRIDASGNVGIGTTTPGARLHNAGSTRLDGNVESASTIFVYSWNGGSQGQVRSGIRMDGSNQVLQFYTQVAERARITAAGEFQFNSGYGSVATAFGCRAWVNFNGTGTVAIRSSGNVSSITDNGTGDYTVNFTTAMPDANYATSGSASRSGASTRGTCFELHPTTVATTSAVTVRTVTVDTNPQPVDSNVVNVSIFR